MDVNCKCKNCEFCFEGDCQLVEINVDEKRECTSYKNRLNQYDEKGNAFKTGVVLE